MNKTFCDVCETHKPDIECNISGNIIICDSCLKEKQNRLERINNEHISEREA